ncbi:MAG TPA: hypothetical protein VJ831_10870 [Jatrophihabitantaceae bacterium]|nr:hypothetical protein [Jatrophihabitantaceae bacterium]
MRAWRWAFATPGIGLLGFGLFRLVTQIPVRNLAVLILWLIAAVLIHDGVLSPLILAIGRTVAHLPARVRRYVQVAFVAAAPVTVIAMPLIFRRGSQPASKALLRQNYAAHLGVLVSVIAGTSLLAYALRVARDYRSPSGPLLPAGGEQRLQDHGEGELPAEREPTPPTGKQGSTE